MDALTQPRASQGLDEQRLLMVEGAGQSVRTGSNGAALSSDHLDGASSDTSEEVLPPDAPTRVDEDLNIESLDLHESCSLLESQAEQSKKRLAELQQKISETTAKIAKLSHDGTNDSLMRLQKLVLEKFESDRKVADAEQQLRQIEAKAARLNKEEANRSLLERLVLEKVKADQRSCDCLTAIAQLKTELFATKQMNCTLEEQLSFEKRLLGESEQQLLKIAAELAEFKKKQGKRRGFWRGAYLGSACIICFLLAKRA